MRLAAEIELGNAASRRMGPRKCMVIPCHVASKEASKVSDERPSIMEQRASIRWPNHNTMFTQNLRGLDLRRSKLLKTSFCGVQFVSIADNAIDRVYN
jgi:hypothetical protein